MDDSERRSRAHARYNRATLRKAQLQPREEDLSPIRGPEAVALVHQLTIESWSLTGRAMPDYTRDRIPCRFVPWHRA